MAMLVSAAIPRFEQLTLCLQYYTYLSSEAFGNFQISMTMFDGTRDADIRDLSGENVTDSWHARMFEISSKIYGNSVISVAFVVGKNDDKKGKFQKL